MTCTYLLAHLRDGAGGLFFYKNPLPEYTVMVMRRLKHSFINAFRGLRDLIYTQQNFVIELVIGAIVLLAAYFLHLRTLERVALVIMIVFVLAAESANSVMENILDGVSKNFSPRFRMAKDMLAGVTLIVAIGAAVIGIIIFYPYIRFLIWPN